MKPIESYFSFELQNIITQFVEKPPKVKIAFSRRDQEFRSEIHKTIRNVSKSIEKKEFDKAVKFIQNLVDFYKKADLTEINIETVDFMMGVIIQLSNPFYPQLCDELWNKLHNRTDITWPEYDPTQILIEMKNIKVLVNGEERARVSIPEKYSEEYLKRFILKEYPPTIKILHSKKIDKVTHLRNKSIDFIIKKL